jgi:hypothetical protein
MIFFKNYYIMEAYSKENPTIKFRACLSYDSGKANLSDTYNTRKLCNNIANTIIENINGSDTNTGYYVYVDTATETFGLDAEEMTLEEYMDKYTHEKFGVHIFVYKKYANKVSKNIGNAFQGLDCISGNVIIYIVNNRRTLSNIEDYLENNALMYAEFTSAYYPVEYLPYKDGEIQATDEEIRKAFSK